MVHERVVAAGGNDRQYQFSDQKKKKKKFQQMYFIKWPNGALLLNRKNMF